MAMKFQSLRSTDFDSIRLRVASPEAIRAWSYGEVSKPETINYRTQKPEKQGLFAEEIFGPSKDWECYCGKYKKIRYKGIICDKCNVEVTQASVRRERMGHIDLASPVTHIWFLRGVPSKIGTMLDMGVQSLEKVVYFANFIITDVNEDARQMTVEQVKEEYRAKKKMIEGEVKRDITRAEEKFEGDKKALKSEIDRIEAASTERLNELEEDFIQVDKDLKELTPLRVISEATYHDWSMRYGHIFDAGIGAEAIMKLLERINISETVVKLTDELAATSSTAKYERIMRRLKLFKALEKNGIAPQWMVLRVLPVIPPDLRPMVPLDGGRFATSDLNDLYRRVINRNNRLRRLYALNAPEVITRNEKRMLQEAVDALIDNSSRQSKTVIAATGKKRQLKSLADILKGKQGRFRQNLLGKRIDYSGRSVIVVGPHLKLHQCGIPKKMALELFRPFVISKLIAREYVHNIRSANRFLESDRPEVWDILEEVVADSYVLLNRAPTLHRLGIQAFRPTLIEGKAIQIHPLVCDAYNADFDGDQMAVHVPLTTEAKKEAEELLLSIRNLLKPSFGGPVATPGKDIAWACFYLTSTDTEPDEKTMKSFADDDEVLYAMNAGKIRAQDWIRIRRNGVMLVTTPGRIIVNQQFPERIGFQNEILGKKQLANIIRDVLEFYGQEFTATILDNLKDLGFKYATLSGYSWAMAGLPTLKEKPILIGEGDRRVREVEEYYAQGLLTQSERHTQIIKIWTEIKDRIADISKDSLPHDSAAYTMIESGARGAWGQLTQMIGMIGLKSSPSGDIIELPVKSSFKEGVSVLEFFISSHGTRKGLTDTALRTANAGYLTRRLVDVAQDVVVREEDCGDVKGVLLTKEESDEIGEPLLVRILGRIALSDIKIPGEKKAFITAGDLITEDHIRALKKSGKELLEAHVRSVMTCHVRRGVCQKCYGYDLAHNKMVKMGVAIGIMAAQSIGEPGTQLTMRTFHTGGVAGKDITQGLPRVEELFEARLPKRKAIMAEVSGKVEIEKAARTVVQAGTGKHIIDTMPGQKIVKVSHRAVDEKTFMLGRGAKIKVVEGDKVLEGDVIGAKMDGEKVPTDVAGVVKSVGKTSVIVVYEADKIREYIIPQGFTLYIKDGDEVCAGDALTDGHLDLQALFAAKGRDAVQRYLSKEIQFIYASQGQKLNNKHIEVIVRQMLSRVRVTNPNDTELLPGEVIERATLLDQQDVAIAKGGKLAEYEDLLLGVTKVSLSTESWLSSASFQETARVLIGASVTGKIDELQGLKENVIIGRLIPAGTGFGLDTIDEPAMESFEEIAMAAPEKPLSVIDAELKVEGPGMGKDLSASESKETAVE
ncbi:MAG: DNA-directed RNA polymerase subunit beta' [Patescibacteria group bacterium]